MDVSQKGSPKQVCCARPAKEVEQKKSLSPLLAQMAGFSSSATEPHVNFVAQLRQRAVELYLQEMDNPSESLNDPVMTLLSEAHSLSLRETSSETIT